MNEVPTVIKHSNSTAAVCLYWIRIQYPPRSSKIEILVKIANGFDTLSRLQFLQKAQSKMLVGFLNLPCLMNRLQHKNHCIF